MARPTLSELIAEARDLMGLAEETRVPDLGALVSKIAKAYGGPGPVDGAQLSPVTEPKAAASKRVKHKPKLPKAVPPIPATRPFSTQ